MPFPLHLFNPQAFPKLTPRRVTVARFVRAVSGFSAADASDPDDRGFNPDPNFANFHGPAFGISGPDGATPAQQCRIRVLRDRLEPAAQLFPEIGDTGLVSLVSPATGAPLNPNPVPGQEPDTIVVRAARSPASATSTSLKLHYGSATGPVVAECTIRVCPIISIPCKCHLVTINGTTCSSTEQTFKDLVANANKILASVGIKLTAEAGVVADSHVGFTTANAITMTSTGDWDAEIAKVMRKNPQPGVMNVYIVGHLDDIETDGSTTRDNTNGVGISANFANANRAHGTYVGAQVGFVMRDPGDMEAFSATFAHELGHVLTLEHYDNKNGSSVLDNNWSMRNLMYNFSQLSTGAPQDQVGYGSPPTEAGVIRRGQFLGIKQMGKINQSQQSDVMRTGALNGTYLPI